MANATDTLKTGSSVLADTHTRLEETVNVGEGIMGELHRNRETMTRVRGNVGVVSGALDEARKLLRGMMKREARTRVALGIFAVVLVAVIIGMIGASCGRVGARRRRARARAAPRRHARSITAPRSPTCSLARQQPTALMMMRIIELASPVPLAARLSDPRFFTSNTSFHHRSLLPTSAPAPPRRRLCQLSHMRPVQHSCICSQTLLKLDPKPSTSAIGFFSSSSVWQPW